MVDGVTDSVSRRQESCLIGSNLQRMIGTWIIKRKPLYEIHRTLPPHWVVHDKHHYDYDHRALLKIDSKWSILFFFTMLPLFKYKEKCFGA
jgi:hypothetical protein